MFSRSSTGLTATDGIETVIPMPRSGSMSSVQSDEALALAAREDRSAFVSLYTRHVERVERYVLSHTADRSDLEDIVSIIFMRALERIHQFRPERGSFAGWLFGIARNAVHDRHRAGRRYLPGAGPHETLLGPSAEDSTLQRERLDGLEKALQHLTADQRDALALRYAAGLPFTEIGRLLGKSDDAAQKLVHRAIDGLRRELVKEDEA
jgi:RNA polymerase sigma-70 factor (ECF subfamily)